MIQDHSRKRFRRTRMSSPSAGWSAWCRLTHPRSAGQVCSK